MGCSRSFRRHSSISGTCIMLRGSFESMRRFSDLACLLTNSPGVERWWHVRIWVSYVSKEFL